MQESLQLCASQPGAGEDVLVLPHDVFRALHPIDQIMARALEKVGKVRIERDDDTTR